MTDIVTLLAFSALTPVFLLALWIAHLRLLRRVRYLEDNRDALWAQFEADSARLQKLETAMFGNGNK